MIPCALITSCSGLKPDELVKCKWLYFIRFSLVVHLNWANLLYPVLLLSLFRPLVTGHLKFCGVTKQCSGR